ncbi:MAG: diacylglycerol/polyprenol kinase family protein [Fidelibacterota bacterium]
MRTALLKEELPRKIFHLSSTLIPIIYFFVERSLAFKILLSMAIFSLIVELIRFRSETVGRAVNFVFGRLMREHETRRISGSTYLLMAASAAVYFFPKPVAIMCLFFVSISDLIAALVGKSLGGVKMFGKTLEGSIAFLISAVVIVLLIPGIKIFPGIAAALTAAVIELLPIPIDDNLIIPLIPGFVFYLITM